MQMSLLRKILKVGDLVTDIDSKPLDAPGRPHELLRSTGIVLAVIDDVEIPPLIEILWNNGYISKVYADELEVLNERR